MFAQAGSVAPSLWRIAQAGANLQPACSSCSLFPVLRCPEVLAQLKAQGVLEDQEEWLMLRLRAARLPAPGEVRRVQLRKRRFDLSWYCEKQETCGEEVRPPQNAVLVGSCSIARVR